MNNEDFIKIYEGVENGKIPSICGRSFSAAQYADLADLIFSEMYEMKDYLHLIKYIEWINSTIRCRKEKRFYQDFLHSYYISKATPIINDAGKRYPFHGGCIGCVSYEKYETKYCRECCYFNADWSKPSRSGTSALMDYVADTYPKKSKYRKVEVSDPPFFIEGYFHRYVNIEDNIFALVEDEFGDLKHYNLGLYNLRFLEPLKKEQ